jgi:hypothetical protein
MTIDPYDTGRCPVGTRCECCGDDPTHLSVIAAWTPVGIVCLTACPGCAEQLDRGCPHPIRANRAT